MPQASGTIVALNGTVAATTNDFSVVGFEITGTWVATLIVEATLDDTNWFSISAINPVDSSTVTTFTANTQLGVHCGGFSQVRIRASLFTSGTVNVAWNNGFGSNFINIAQVGGVSVAAVTSKTAQPSSFVGTQTAHDTGRTYVTFNADAVAGVVAETLLTFSVTKQGVVTAGQTNYTPTSGKTLRITGAFIETLSGAGAGGWTRIKLRHNTAGATTTSSALVFTAGTGTTNANAVAYGDSFPIPEGLEIYGDGTQTIGITHISAATTTVESITVFGYEY